MSKKRDRKQHKGFVPSGSGGLLGGSKKQKKPPETSNSGYSNSFAEITGIVSEGPIEGISKIYIDETPVQNEDGSLNFSGLHWDIRTGTQNQDRIIGTTDDSGDILSETNLNQEVIYNQQITRQIINKNLDYIRVRVGVQLQEFPENGGVLGSSVHYQIWVKQGAAGWELRYNDVFSGRYSQLTEFEFHVPVDNQGGTRDTFLIRVVRMTPTDADQQRYQRTLKWQSYTEGSAVRLNYPNSALIAVRLDATQFSSSPSFAFLVNGRLLQVPTNSTVDIGDRGLNYSNTPWNGEFWGSYLACADPVWILYDLLTNNRYGLGRYIKTQNINRYSFYEISQYCNQLVPDGKGWYERRFLCNVLLNGTEDAYKVIESLRSIFRGFSYFANGTISFAADMPGTVAMQFTQADIEDGMFSYARTSLKSRHTVAHVTWIDPSDFYKRAIEVVEDVEGIDKFGVRTLELSAFGCTSRGQARRAGLSALFTERLEVETVTFKARAYAANCIPGMIISVHDARRADIRYGGLIVDFDTTANWIEIDHPVNLSSSETYSVNYMNFEGKLETRTINPTTSTSTRLQLVEALTLSPNPMIEGNWIITSSTLEPQLFRVLNRVPVAGEDDMLYEITALQYQPDKYNAIEYGLALTTRQTRIKAPSVPNKPYNVTTQFQVVQSGVDRRYVLNVTWDAPITVDGNKDEYTVSYLVEYKKGLSGDWIDTTSTTLQYMEYVNLINEVYYVRVAAVNIEGKSSAWVESNAIQLGLINVDLSYASSHSSMFIVEF